MEWLKCFKFPTTVVIELIKHENQQSETRKGNFLFNKLSIIFITEYRHLLH